MHLVILGFPMGGGYQYRDIFARFLRGLKLFGQSGTEQVLLVSKKKIGDNDAFFRDNKASIWEKNAIHCFVFYCFSE